MMRWIGRMDAQRALVEGGKDDAGTGELVFILIKILILIIKIFIILISILIKILIVILISLFLSPHPHALLVEGS